MSLQCISYSYKVTTFLCVCGYRGEGFPQDMSSCSRVSLAALHQAECLLAPGHRGIGRLDGWMAEERARTPH